MFDYLGILISVILGLALTHVLRGLAKLIQLRHECRPYWVQIAWTINVVTFVLGIWWGMFWWKGLNEWTVEWFLFIAAYAIVLFMWASMLYPPEFTADLRFEEYFLANRRWFFGTQLVAVLMDIPETTRKATLHLRAVPKQYSLFIAILVAVTLLGMYTSNRRVHGALAVIAFLTLIGYLFLTPLEKIVFR